MMGLLKWVYCFLFHRIWVDDHPAGFHQLLGGSVGWWTKSLPWKNGCVTNPAIIATPFFYTLNLTFNWMMTIPKSLRMKKCFHPSTERLVGFKVSGTLFLDPHKSHGRKEPWNLTNLNYVYLEGWSGWKWRSWRSPGDCRKLDSSLFPSIFC